MKDADLKLRERIKYLREEREKLLKRVEDIERKTKKIENDLEEFSSKLQSHILSLDLKLERTEEKFSEELKKKFDKKDVQSFFRALNSSLVASKIDFEDLLVKVRGVESE